MRGLWTGMLWSLKVGVKAPRSIPNMLNDIVGDTGCGSKNRPIHSPVFCFVYFCLLLKFRRWIPVTWRYIRTDSAAGLLNLPRVYSAFPNCMLCGFLPRACQHSQLWKATVKEVPLSTWLDHCTWPRKPQSIELQAWPCCFRVCRVINPLFPNRSTAFPLMSLHFPVSAGLQAEHGEQVWVEHWTTFRGGYGAERSERFTPRSHL